MLKYMLDTNIVIYTMKNRPERVRDAFKKHEGQMGRALGLVLVTNNENEFQRVPGLMRENWA